MKRLLADSAIRSASPSTRDQRHTLLVVDDDDATCSTFLGAFRLAGIDAIAASCGAEAARALATCRFDVAIIDIRLPDVDGLELVRLLSTDFNEARTIVISGWLTTDTTVQAVKLGASAVFDKPIDVTKLVDVVLQLLVPERSAPAMPDTSAPRSVPERWAMMIVRAHEATDDPRTLSELAKTVAVSTSTFCEICRLVDVRPHDARDLARMMRAIRLSHLERCNVKMFLNISDHRTLQSLFRRAGLMDAKSQDNARIVSVEGFLLAQRFIAQDNKAFQKVRSLIARQQLA